MLLVRFCCALVSCFIFTSFMSRLTFMLWSVRCSEFGGPDCWDEFYSFSNLTFAFQVFSVFAWIVIWAGLETMAYRQSTRARPRLLTHLRYGPIAIIALSLAVLPCYDMMMIQYSRWQIVAYIHSNASPWEPPNFTLHDDRRNVCTFNPAHWYELYGATVAEYLDDPDPLIRARALRATIYISPWDGALRKAQADQHPLVRHIADEYYSENWTSHDF